MNPLNSQEEEEKCNSKEILNLKESSSSSSSSEKNSNSDADSMSDSIDEERMTLGQINKRARKYQKSKEKMNILSFLKNKRYNEGNVITYDEKKGKILKEFVGNIDDLNEFLSKCEVKKINFNDNLNILNNNNNSLIFDPNEWMKENNIVQRTLSLEDLTGFYQKKSKKEENKKEKNNKFDNKFADVKIIKKEKKGLYTGFSRVEDYFLYKGVNRTKQIFDHNKYARIYIRADNKLIEIKREYQKALEFYADATSLLGAFFF